MNVSIFQSFNKGIYTLAPPHIGPFVGPSRMRAQARSK